MTGLEKGVFIKMRDFLFFMLIISTQKIIISGKKSHSKQQNEHESISRLLDKLLENYVKLFISPPTARESNLCLLFHANPPQDNKFRPNFGRKPAVVEIDMMVRSMGPVSEIDMVRTPLMN